MEIIQNIIDFQTTAFTEGTGLPSEAIGPILVGSLLLGVLIGLI